MGKQGKIVPRYRLLHRCAAMGKLTMRMLAGEDAPCPWQQKPKAGKRTETGIAKKI